MPCSYPGDFRMKQVLIKQGRAIVEDIPAPVVDAGKVLVRVDHSCISVGTEMSGVKASAQPLWKRALSQPGKIKKAWKMIETHGLSRLHSVVQGKLSAAVATGYSAAGTVLEAGAGIHDLCPGDRVACAGAQYAHHAEIIAVPRNLVVPIPDDMAFADASTVTLGAIALQGVRRGQPTLGETFVVLGLGILGQLAAQLLRANGCRVIGVDLDRGRIDMARRLGMPLGIHPDDGDDIEQVARLSDGVGADGVIITAATPSHEVISTAFRMCRKKGRVVLVGDVGLHLNRADFYEKEIDFFISTSYGPGRYDRHYEEEGLDYPVGYVRWTENRNMAEYLRLVASGQVSVRPLVSATYPIAQASEAYEKLQAPGPKPLMVLLSYPQADAAKAPERVVANPWAVPAGNDRVRLAVVGAGSFARGMHLPNIQQLSKLISLRAVVSRTGHNAVAAALQFGAAYASTDYQKVLDDPEVDAVLIATRHHLHAAMTLQALRAGKHVLVEKPLALTRAELKEISEFFTTQGPERRVLLLTGFNRRFSPHVQQVRRLLESRTHPIIVNYRMNAGHIPLDHWVHSAEGGGRNRGEACHIYDLFTALINSKIVARNVQCLKPGGQYYSQRDNFVVTLSFADGSVATLTYTALGSSNAPKEQMDIFVDGKVVSLTDYKRLTITGTKSTVTETRIIEKGQKEELESFARAIRDGGDWPIPLWQQVQATEIACDVEETMAHRISLAA